MTQTSKLPGRNDPCHCGSGRKYKQCCLAKDEEALRKARAEAAAAAKEAAAAEPEPAEEDTPHTHRGAPHQHDKAATAKPWKRSTTPQTAQRTIPRKAGSK